MEALKAFRILISKFFEKNIKDECPAFHSCLKITAFYTTVKKIIGQNSKSSIEFDGNNIKINPNTWPDLQIAAASLPYVKKFVTLDKGLALLLEKLFPQYKKKIQFIIIT
jgi:hypothetical protein